MFIEKQTNFTVDSHKRWEIMKRKQKNTQNARHKCNNLSSKFKFLLFKMNIRELWGECGKGF